MQNEIIFEKKHRYLTILEEADALETEIRSKNLYNSSSLEDMRIALSAKLLAFAGLVREGVVTDVIETESNGEKVIRLAIDGKNYQFDATEAHKVLKNGADAIPLLDGEELSHSKDAPVKKITAFISEERESVSTDYEEEDVTYESIFNMDEDTQDEGEPEVNIDEIFVEEVTFEDENTNDSSQDDPFSMITIEEDNLTYDVNTCTINRPKSKGITNTVKIMVAPLGSGVRNQKKTEVVMFAALYKNDEITDYTYGHTAEGESVELELDGMKFTVCGNFTGGKFTSNIDTKEDGTLNIETYRAAKGEQGYILKNIEDLTIRVFPTFPDQDGFVTYITDEEENELMFSNYDQEIFEIYGNECTISAYWENDGTFNVTFPTDEALSEITSTEDNIEEEATEEIEVIENTKPEPKNETKNSFLSKLLIDLLIIGIIALGYIYFKFGTIPLPF